MVKLTIEMMSFILLYGFADPAGETYIHREDS
jgi:hypothetical protein